MNITGIICLLVCWAVLTTATTLVFALNIEYTESSKADLTSRTSLIMYRNIQLSRSYLLGHNYLIDLN